MKGSTTRLIQGNLGTSGRPGDIAEISRSLSLALEVAKKGNPFGKKDKDGLQDFLITTFDSKKEK